jgi:hypothetical protein
MLNKVTVISRINATIKALENMRIGQIGRSRLMASREAMFATPNNSLATPARLAFGKRSRMRLSSRSSVSTMRVASRAV